MSSDLRADLDDSVVDEAKRVENEVGEIIGHYKSDGESGGAELGLYEDWMPDSDDHEGKTHITQHQAHSLAAMMNISEAYDLLGMHIDGLDDFLESVAMDYMKLLPSIEGESRDQQMRVLMAKAGVHPDEEQATRALWSKALTNGGADDDD